MLVDPDRERLMRCRQEVRAGVTGWSQTRDQMWLTWEERLRLDLFYIEHWSLALDLYILCKTFWEVIRFAASSPAELTLKPATLASSPEVVWPPRLRSSFLDAAGASGLRGA